jgi:glutathione S-transferase
MKKLPKGYALCEGEPVATEDLYSEEQVKKLKAHIQRAAVLLKTVDDDDLVTVARAIIRLRGRLVKEGLATLSNSLTQRRYAIGEIAAAACPEVFQPAIYKGQKVTEAMESETPHADAYLARCKARREKGGVA